MSDKVLIERELLERLADIAEIEGQPEGEKARAILTAQPQASAAQSAHMVPVDFQHCVFRGKNADGSEPINFQITQESPLRFGEIASIKMHGWLCIGPLQDSAAQSAPDEREAVARAICSACDETPEHKGDAQGNAYRWQDYLPAADAAIGAWQRAQSAPVVPELDEGSRVPDDYRNQASGYRAGWNDCRAMLAAAPQPAAQGEFGDAYQGAREDLAIWKRRALEAEAKVRHQEQIIDHLTLEAQGESRMGEPVIPPARQEQGDEAKCVWKRDEDTGAYETKCGSIWHLTDGGEPDEHGQYYCHHCGKPIDDGKE